MTLTRILIDDSQLPPVQCPMILGTYLVKSHEMIVVLEGRPPTINNSEKEYSTIAQLRSGYRRLLGSLKSRIKKDISLNVCADGGIIPHDGKHLFVFPGPPDDNDTVGFMEQTGGRCLGTQLSQGVRTRLK